MKKFLSVVAVFSIAAVAFGGVRNPGQFEMDYSITNTLASTNYVDAAIAAATNTANLQFVTEGGNTTSLGIAVGGLTNNGNVDWAAGNMIDVPVGNITPYITAASAGDTLILGSGYYETTDPTIAKKIHIVGQGPGSTIVTSRFANGNVFDVQVDDVLLANFSTRSDKNDNADVILVNGDNFGEELVNVVVQNVEVNLSGSYLGNRVGFQWLNAGGRMENCRIFADSSSGICKGIEFVQNATCDNPVELKVFNCDIWSEDNGVEANASASSISAELLLFDCVVEADVAVESIGGNVTTRAKFCTLDGTTTDAKNTSGSAIYLSSTLLMNFTTSGTISRDGTLVVDSIDVSGGTYRMAGNPVFRFTNNQVVVSYPLSDTSGVEYVSSTNLFTGAGTTGLVTSTAGDTTKFLRGDGAWQAGVVAEVDPVWAAVSNQYAKTNWVTAQGYLTSELDPIWVAVSNQYAKTNANISGFNNDAGYLTAYIETDPIWGSVSNLYAKTNWVTGQGYLTSELDPVWSAASNLYAKIGGVGGWTNLSQYNNDSGFLTTETDPLWNANSNRVVYTNDPVYLVAITNGAVQGGTNFSAARSGRILNIGFPTNNSFFANDSGYLTVYVETDPIWSAVSNLYAKTNWVTSQGYLTTETDPIWGAASNLYVKKSNGVTNDGPNTYAAGVYTQDFSGAGIVVDLGTNAFVNGVRLAGSTNFVGIVTTNNTDWLYMVGKTSNWDTAYGWGDWSASVQIGHLEAGSNNWNTAFGWGDHSTAGYASTSSVVNISNRVVAIEGKTNDWNTAFGWGNHASAGYLNNANQTNIVRAFTLEIQDMTNGIAYWMANPFGTRSCTIQEVYVKAHGATGNVAIVSQHRTQGWYTYNTVDAAVPATATGTADTSFSGSAAVTNGMRIGMIPANLSAFATTNLLSVDFKISCP